MGTGQSFQLIVLRKLKIHMQNVDLHVSLLFTKINSKCTKDLYQNDKTIKLLEGNIGASLYNIAFDNNIINLISKTQVTKKYIDKLEWIKIRNFLHIRRYYQ